MTAKFKMPPRRQNESVPESQELADARAIAAKAPTSRLNVEIPTNLHKRLRMQALLEDRPIMSIVAEQLESYLSNVSDEGMKP